LAFILGAGMTRVGRWYDKGLRAIALEAASRALEESGVDGVDFLIVASSASYATNPQLDLSGYLASSLGLRGVRALSVEAGEASGMAAIAAAHHLIASGAARSVMVVGVDKLTEEPSGRVYSRIKNVYDREAEGFYGISHAAIPGILMRLYMERYGVDRETLSYWPAVMHSHGKENPYAMLRFAVKPEKVSTGMPVAYPLTLLDSFPLGDGAAALLLEPGNAGMASIEAVESSMGAASIAFRDDPLWIESVGEAWRRALDRAGGGRGDVVELHDSYSIMGILILESMRLTERGKAAELMAEGYFTVGGDGPLVNPSGGLKARGHPVGATGLYMAAEIAMQLSGSFPGVKAEDARMGAAISINGHGSSAYAAILRRA